MTKVGFMSLGCPKNLVDSEVMLGHLKLKGFTLTPDAAEAEVLVVNTCGFIESAKKESIEAILQAAAYKRDGACRRLVVAGCMVERYRDQLLADMPEIDACLGTRDIEHIAEVVGAADRLFEPERDPGYLYDEHSPRLLTTPKASAYLKISEGCDHHCAFCIIPAIRGPQRSRTIASVVAEALAGDPSEPGCEDPLRTGLSKVHDVSSLMRAELGIKHQADQLKDDFKSKWLDAIRMKVRLPIMRKRESPSMSMQAPDGARSSQTSDSVQPLPYGAAAAAGPAGCPGTTIRSPPGIMISPSGPPWLGRRQSISGLPRTAITSAWPGPGHSWMVLPRSALSSGLAPGGAKGGKMPKRGSRSRLSGGSTSASPVQVAGSITRICRECLPDSWFRTNRRPSDTRKSMGRSSRSRPWRLGMWAGIRVARPLGCAALAWGSTWKLCRWLRGPMAER